MNILALLWKEARIIDMLEILPLQNWSRDKHGIYIAFLGNSFLRSARIADKKDRHDTIELGWDLLNKEFPDWHKNPYLKTMKGMKNKYFSMVYSWNIYFFAWLFRNFKKDNV